MKASKLKTLLSKGRCIILDGSSGAALQKRGMPKGACPEKWAFDNPEPLIKLQKEYIGAGSQVLYTFTLGGTRPKLDEFGFGRDTAAINERLARISRQAAGKKALVAGDIGPTGRFPKPFGDLDFESCVDIFKEQAAGLLKGGVDLFVIETMIDIQEARAALLACKELSDLPVIVSMTFDKDKRTLTGTDPVSAMITLQALGADVVGVNCSTGPEEMVEVVKAMKPYAKIPIIAKPNAGLPRLVNGATVFDMKAREFASYTKALVKAGACMIGGCCGTSPEYISAMSAESRGMKALKGNKKGFSMLSSARKTVFIGRGSTAIIGERINPTGKKQLQEELKAGVTAEVRRFAVEQVEKGASVLDVNMGMPGIDEKETMKKVVDLLSTITDAPLCIDSSSPEVIEAALRVYPGRALINSISGEPSKMKKLLAVAKKYGAMFILLPLGGKGVPPTAIKRQAVVNKVFKAAKKLGFTNKDIVIDGLVMTVSSNQEAAIETLKLIKWASAKGFNSVVGLSNVSFGLPERALVNAAFLKMAKAKGLTMAIANPAADLKTTVKEASDVLTGKDKGCRVWVGKYGQKQVQGPGSRVQGEVKSQIPNHRSQTTIYDAVVNGNKEIITGLINAALTKGQKPNDIVDKILVPAITQVGDLYEKKTYFLPQLIASADAMKAAFAVLEPLLIKSGTGNQESGIVLATVKGDIHDIGKNIVALMLKNYGFTVYDMGKDVHEFAIVQKARETKARIIGLSALMTTTMIEMKVVIDLAKKEGLDCKFMVGGAVVTDAYAKEIGADAYAKDAYEAVKLAKNLAEKG